MESAGTPQPRPPPDRAAATCHNAALVMTASMTSWTYWPDLGVHRGLFEQGSTHLAAELKSTVARHSDTARVRVGRQAAAAEGDQHHAPDQ